MRWALAMIASLMALGVPTATWADEIGMPMAGSWRIKFSNGVEEQCVLKADRTARVWEPRRQSAGKIEVREGRVLIVSDDGRLERWTPIGRRAVVEHWASSTDYPQTSPVLGIAEFDQENGRKDRRNAPTARRETNAMMAAKTLVDAMRPARAANSAEMLRECIDPRYLKEHNLEGDAIPVRRVATGAILAKSMVDSRTVFMLVETAEAEKEVWLLRVAEVDGRIYIVPPQPPDRDTKTFAAWIFRWKL
jgi:hypothetical protein